MADGLSVLHQTRLELDASHAHHRLLAEQVARILEDNRALQARLDEIAGVHDDVKTISATLNAHIKREEAMLQQAFPQGDLTAHRIAHEQMIEALREEAKFWRELRLDLAKKGIWGLAVIIVGLALVGITFKLGLAR